MKASLQRILTSKFISLFYASNSSDMISLHLSKFTLRFKIPEVETHYCQFVDKDQKWPAIIIAIVVAVLFLCYIGLDASYSKFFDLMLTRVATSVVLFFLVLLSLPLSSHGFYPYSFFGALAFIITISSSLYTLVLRNDISCSPNLFILLWATNYVCAPFLPYRTFIGIGTIIIHTFVWLFYLHMSTVSFLNQQTLNYSLFYFGVLIAAYSREIMHRKVYLQTHAIISSIPGLIARSPSSSLSSPSLPSSHLSSSPSSSPLSPSSSFHLSSTASSTSSFSDSPSSSPSLLQNSPRKNSTNLQKNRKSVWISVNSKNSVAAFSSGNFGSAETELFYHKAIWSNIKTHSNKFTLRFKDAEKEEKFSEWHLKETLHSLRRFLALNIVSFAFCVTHDLEFPQINWQQKHDLLAMRFGIILPSFIVCFFLVFWNRVAYSPWRRRFVFFLELIVTITTITTSVFMYAILDDPDCSGDFCPATRAWNLYFGSAERILIFSFTGMGLLWVHSFAATLIVMVFNYALTLTYAVYALTPLMLCAAGFAVAYVDERTRRAEFYLTFYAEELTRHLDTEFVKGHPAPENSNGGSENEKGNGKKSALFESSVSILEDSTVDENFVNNDKNDENSKISSEKSGIEMVEVLAKSTDVLIGT